MDLQNTPLITYLSFAGIFVLFLCIILIIFRKTDQIKAPEKIKAFGVELEISVLTILVLIGFLLSISSIYLHVSDYQQQIGLSKNQIEILKNENELRKKELEAARRIDMTVFFRLPVDASSNNQPKLGDLVARYYLRDQPEKPIQTDISRGNYEGNSYRVVLKNLTPDTHIETMEIENLRTKEIWVKKNFFPLNPVYDLKKEE